jgi:predicted site-specific integrase-resolvase
MTTAVALPPAEARKLLNTEQAAEYLGIRPQTLRLWHCTGRYNLPVVKVGRATRYRVCDLEQFIASRTVTHS